MTRGKYTVQGTDLKHKKVLYPEGSTIELTKEEAAAISNWMTSGRSGQGIKEPPATKQTETDSTGSEQAAGELADTDSAEVEVPADESAASDTPAVEAPAGDVPSGEPTKNKKEK